MAINTSNVSLRISAGFPSQFPRDPLPQIAFSGRSNVGKSSLINTLLGRKSLARVSASPGTTVTVNFYDVDRALFLVDLPGYGYARRALEDKKKWSALTDGYFSNNPNIDLLKKTGVQIPFPVKVYYDLKNQGIALNNCPLTNQELFEALCSLN